MHILITINQRIPAKRYGGSERVVWDLGRELTNRGHRVTFLAKEGSSCDFTQLIPINPERPLCEQIPPDVDIVHSNEYLGAELNIPHIITVHGTTNNPDHIQDRNSVFVSQDHARRMGSDSYVYNGLNWDDYPAPNLSSKRTYFHFLGKAAWRRKNIKGCIKTVRQAKQPLRVMGGTRLNFKMGFRFTPYPSIQFEGMVDNDQKAHIMNGSKGLVFPVRWNEPFGLAITESLYFGCPVFGTPYGSLPELVTEDVGFLSTSSAALAEQLNQSDRFSKQTCHEYARDLFSAKVMAERYLEKYETVLNGRFLNDKPPRLQQVQTEKLLPFN
jgi:glycosyltransferase involved in cell wall biosynthesis